jgi:hypothetical protein
MVPQLSARYTIAFIGKFDARELEAKESKVGCLDFSGESALAELINATVIVAAYLSRVVSKTVRIAFMNSDYGEANPSNSNHSYC